MQTQLVIVIFAICVAVAFMARKVLRTVRRRGCDDCHPQSSAACQACREQKLQELKPR